MSTKQIGLAMFVGMLALMAVRVPIAIAMFVPGDGFLAAALDRLPELMAEAMDRRVVLVTPTVFSRLPPLLISACVIV